MLATTNFLVPNGTFVVELLAFLIVLFALSRFLPRIQAVLDKRREIIRQGLADAEEAKRQKQQAENERQQIVAEARLQARGLVEEANKMAEQARNERLERAKAEYERIVSSADMEVKAQARRATIELRTQAADLAIAVAEKVLGEGLDHQAQSALIDRTIEEVSSSGDSVGEKA